MDSWARHCGARTNLYDDYVLDYHLHLWPHGSPDHAPTLDELAEFCELAQRAGVKEIALTEHLFRFRQADAVLGRYFRRFPATPMRDLMEQYWQEHARADLDQYVEMAVAAKRAGLPLKVGLEVDYYEDHMDQVKELLAPYPFDVLLGSVHWIDDWPFDHVSDPEVIAAWDRYGVEPAWQAYTRALEELADSDAIDVLAHPDLIKIMGHRPEVPDEYYHRMAEAAANAGIAAEVSTAGWRKPVNEIYPAPALLDYFFRYGVPITTATDSHGTGHIGFRMDDSKAYVRSAGYEALVAFEARSPYSVTIEG